MTWKRIGVAVCLAAVPAAALAQRPPGPGGPASMMAPMPPPPPPPPPDLGKWWKNSEIVAALKLTAAQIDKIEQVFLEQRLKLVDLRADLEREELKLQPLIEADQPDEAQVGAAIDRVTAARGKLEKANAMMMLAIRRVLSVDQWHTLESLKQQRERPPMPPPPGGPRGGPGRGPQERPGDGPAPPPPPAR